MDREQPDYLSYLLRLWRVSGEGEAPWRASLESPHTGERRGFANLDRLCEFLQRETGAVPDTREDQDGGQQRGGDNTTEKQGDTLP